MFGILSLPNSHAWNVIGHNQSGDIAFKSNNCSTNTVPYGSNTLSSNDIILLYDVDSVGLISTANQDGVTTHSSNGLTPLVKASHCAVAYNFCPLFITNELGAILPFKYTVTVSRLLTLPAPAITPIHFSNCGCAKKLVINLF
jgi:hypothetical protein